MNITLFKFGNYSFRINFEYNDFFYSFYLIPSLSFANINIYGFVDEKNNIKNDGFKSYTLTLHIIGKISIAFEYCITKPV